MKYVVLIAGFLSMGCNQKSNHALMSYSDSLKREKDLDLVLNTINQAYDALKSWRYEGAIGKVDGDSIHTASLLSSNMFYRASDHDSSICGLVIRRIRESESVYIFVTRGSFQVSQGKAVILTRFDLDSTEMFEAWTPKDEDSTFLFIENDSLFIAKLKNAKKLTIEVGIADNGKQTQIFNVAGLIWK